MGGQASTTSSENPNSGTTATAGETTSAAMSSLNSPQAHESKPQSEPTHDPKPPEAQAKLEESSSDKKTPEEDLEGEQEDAVPEEEEEGECGFCLFMKGGGCKEVFIEWEKCVMEGEEKEEDIAEKCIEMTANLKKCMEAHADYYGPLLQVEKAAQEEAMKELEEERELVKKGKASQNTTEESDDGVSSVSEQISEEKDGVLGVSDQKIEEKDGDLGGVSDQKIEVKDGDLGVSDQKKEEIY